jgi:hypothetical protein
VVKPLDGTYLDTMQNLLVRIYKMNNTVNDTCP